MSTKSKKINKVDDDTVKTIYETIDEMDIDIETSKEEKKKHLNQCVMKIWYSCKKLTHKGYEYGLEQLKSEAIEERDGVTVLHHAIMLFSFKNDDEQDLIRLFMMRKSGFPDLILQSRAHSKRFGGQTPLHLAVTKGAHCVVDILLENLQEINKEEASSVLQTRAFGPEFRNTVMMAELPLSVAALKNDRKIFQQLLHYGAKLDGQNSRGNNVCHSLITYAYLYSDKLQDVVSMFEYINKSPATKKGKNKKLRKKVWFMKNKEDLSPLQLAAKFGQHVILQFIMELDGYRTQNTTGGLFDIKVYDVTEIDAISFVDPEETSEDNSKRKGEKEHKAENISKYSVETKMKTSKNISVLRRLLELDPGCAFKFIVFTPVRRIIDEKWKVYRWYFLVWSIFHFIHMSILTWYATHRSLQNTNGDSRYDVFLKPNFAYPILGDRFSLGFGIVNILVGLSFLLDAGRRFYLKRMQMRCSSILNPYSNITFQLLFIVLGLSLILDFICAVFSPLYENYLLILAVCTGWFLMLFFLRVTSPFSYFTVMIQNVLIGDLLRFSVVILFELICFSTAMFMVVQGASELDSEYSNYGRVLLSMFKLMVGLGDVGLLYQTRHPVLAIVILIAFIILTTILMINSLIAMISKTSTELAEEAECPGARNMHCQLQRLSAILYIESILPLSCVHLGGTENEALWYNNRSKKRQKMQRRFLKIKSLLNADDTTIDDEEHNEGPNKGLDTILQNIHHNKIQHADHPGDKQENTPNNRQHDETADQLQEKNQSSRNHGSLEIYHRQLCDKCDETKNLDDGCKK